MQNDDKLITQLAYDMTSACPDTLKPKWPQPLHPEAFLRSETVNPNPEPQSSNAKVVTICRKRAGLSCSFSSLSFA